MMVGLRGKRQIKPTRSNPCSYGWYYSAILNTMGQVVAYGGIVVALSKGGGPESHCC